MSGIPKVTEWTVGQELDAVENSVRCLMIYLKDLRAAISREKLADYNDGYADARRKFEKGVEPCR